MFALHQQLIGLCCRHRWLHWARNTQLHLTNEQLVYRTAADGGSLVVTLNLADTPAVVPASGDLVAGHGEAQSTGVDCQPGAGRC